MVQVRSLLHPLTLRVPLKVMSATLILLKINHEYIESSQNI